MSLSSRFWLGDPVPELEELYQRYARSFPQQCELIRIGTSFRGRPLYAFRVGHGALTLAVVAGEHSQEPLNAFGITAFADSILNGVGLDGEDLSPWAADTLQQQSLYLIPIINVDGVARFVRQVPNSWIPAKYDVEGWDPYVAGIREPMLTYGLTRGSPGFNRLSEQQLRAWTEEHGGALGWLFTDQGVDLWEDWEKFDAPETRALNDFLLKIQPDCLFNLHNQETPTNMFVPIPSAHGRAARTQVEYGEEMMTQLKEAGVPCSHHSTRTYDYKEHFQQLPDRYYLRHQCLVLFGEVANGYMPERLRQMMRSNPLQRRDADNVPPTQDDIIRTVWIWLKALVDMGGQRSYR